MLTPDQKGSIAEIEIAAAAIRLGVGVYKPLNDGERYDLIFDHESRLWRVQCKSAVRRGEVVSIHCHSARRSANGFVQRAYTPAEIDAFAAYSIDLDRCFFIPIELFSNSSQIYLRLSPPRNAQRAAINWADRFSFEATLGRSGAIAQLGERLHGMQEVAGSSPAGSTSVGAHEFRNHFGWYMERAAAGDEIAVTRRGKPYVRLVAAQ